QINKNINVEKIVFSPEDHEEKWEKQLILMQQGLNRIIEAYRVKGDFDDHQFLFIFSEVSSMTGIIIKTDEFIEEMLNIPLVNELREKNHFTFFIDASHSVGNYKEAFKEGHFKLQKNDLYIFGAHKWLLSPEPLGILIGLKGGELLKSKSYDCWDEEG